MTEEELRKRYEAYLNTLNIHLVRSIARQVGVEKPTNGKKEELIQKTIDIRMGLVAPVPTSRRGAPLKEEAPSPKYLEELDRIRGEYEKENALKAEQEKTKTVEPLFFVMNTMEARSPEKDYTVKEEVSHRKSGLVEILPDGNGRLLYPNGRALRESVKISAAVIKSSFVREGDIIDYQFTEYVDGETWVKKVDRVNDKYIFAERLHFEEDLPCYPIEKINFIGNGTNNLTCKCLNLFVPMAKGQRVALHAPVGTDVIRFFTNVAVTCKRGIQPIALLIGEAPEDVGRFLSEAPDTEVFSTTFDQTEEEHIRAIKMASARAMRMAEDGKDVILFVDSLTDAAKLFENEGNKLSCGLSSEGVQECKKIFALARDLKRLGSITLFGVIREGESAADRYIAEEFDRLANCHIVFSRELSAQYICPPIDLTKSYTEREYSLLSQKFLSVICGLRAKAAKEGSAGVLTDLDKASGEKAFLDQMSKYQA